MKLINALGVFFTLMMFLPIFVAMAASTVKPDTNTYIARGE